EYNEDPKLHTNKQAIYWVESYKTDDYGYPMTADWNIFTHEPQFGVTATFCEYRIRDWGAEAFHRGVDFDLAPSGTQCYTICRGKLRYKHEDPDPFSNPPITPQKAEELSHVKTDKFNYLHIREPDSTKRNYLKDKIRNSGIPIASGLGHLHFEDLTGVVTGWNHWLTPRVNPLRNGGFKNRPIDEIHPTIDWIRIYNEQDIVKILASSDNQIEDNIIDLDSVSYGLDIVTHTFDETPWQIQGDPEVGVYRIGYKLIRLVDDYEMYNFIDGQYGFKYQFDQQPEDNYVSEVFSPLTRQHPSRYLVYTLTNYLPAYIYPYPMLLAHYIPRWQLSNGDYEVFVSAEDINGNYDTLSFNFSVINGANIAQQTINEDTCWDTDIIVPYNVTITDGATLTINPGVYVTFEGPYSLYVEGSLIVNGTADSMVTFTKSDLSEPWRGIRFINTSPENHSEINYSKIEYCDVESDSSYFYGGALYLENFSNLKVENCHFYKNRAEKGGAVYCINSSPDIINNKFTKNYAQSGGAICCEDASPRIINNFIHINTAQNGSGITLINSSAPLTNNTITYNYADSLSGVIYFDQSSPIVTNTIIWGNYHSHSYYQVFIGSNDANPDFFYCDIQGGQENFGLGPGVVYQGSYENNIDVDPSFINYWINSYMLNENSQCINTGIPDTTGFGLPEYDIAGNPRISLASNMIDIGAYEYPYFLGFIEVSDTLQEDTFWGSDTVYIVGDVIIPEDVTLTINLGVMVLFADNFSIEVYGSLNALGVDDNHINFISANTDVGWGGIRFKVESGNSLSSSTLYYCDFKYGKVTALTGCTNGGAISIESYSDITTANCYFDSCYAEQKGGAIYIFDSSPVLNGNNIKNCQSTFGGAIYCVNSDAKILTNTIYQNMATDGGAVYIDSLCSPYLINNTIVSNNASYGGGIYFNTITALPMVVNTIIYNNSAGSGNQVFLANYDDSLLDPEDEIYSGFYYCDVEGDTTDFGYSFSRNSGRKSPLPLRSSYKHNRKLSNRVSRVSPQKTTDRNRPEGGYPGHYENNIDSHPLFVDENNGNYCLQTISPCINSGCPEGWSTTGLSTNIDSDLLGYSAFDTNYDIGAYECTEFPSSIEVSGIIAQDAFWRSDTVNVVDNIEILLDVSVCVDSSVMIIFRGDYSITVKGNFNAIGSLNNTITFSTPDSINSWGGIKVLEQGSVTLEHCLVVKSNSSLGGVLFTNTSGSINISSCDFMNNSAYHGGVIYCNGGEILIKDCKIHNNTANHGGAIYNLCNDTLIVQSNEIYSNSAFAGREPDGFGGAICTHDDLFLIANFIYDNQADEGGALHQLCGHSILLNNTICHNNAIYHGGGLALKQDQSQATMLNTILWYNSCENDSLSTQVLNEISDAYISFCDIQHLSQEILELPGYEGIAIGNIDAEPVFIDENIRDYHLQSISPCIDNGCLSNWYVVGSDIVISEELIGYPAFGYHYDIGAFEFNGIAPLKVNPSSLDFRNVAIGDHSEKLLTLINRGFGPLSINSIEASQDFEVSLLDKSQTGKKGGSKDNIVPGKVSGAKKIRGESTTKFDGMVGNRSKSRNYTKSKKNIIYSRIVAKEKDKSGKREDEYPIVIEPYDSLLLTVSFQPTLEQEYEGELSINFDYGANQTVTMNLRGVGYDNTIYITEDTIWDADTIYVDRNIVVNSGVTLTITNNCVIFFENNSNLTLQNAILILGENISFMNSEDYNASCLYLIDCDDVIMNISHFICCNLVSENTNVHISNASFENSYIEHLNKDFYLIESTTQETNINAFSDENCDKNDIVHIEGCNMNNCIYNTLIAISSYPNFIILNNNIMNYNTALWINESGHGREYLIKDNIINNNQYGYGIELYHSNADIIGSNNIYTNYIGIAGARNCNIAISGNEDAPYQTIHNNFNKEMVFAHDSFPIKLHKNLIYDDLFPGYYLIKCSHYRPEDYDDVLNVEYNYWGEDFMPENDFYPPDSYIYEPIWIPGDLIENIPDPAQELFESALYNFQLENYLLAQQLFEQVISEFPRSEYALYSAKYLLAVEEYLEGNYSELQQYFNTEPNLFYTDRIRKLADYLANYCNIKMGDYPAAIEWFEEIIEDPPSYSDSLYAVIDIGYTYLLMEAVEKYRNYTGKFPELKPSSREEYLQTREYLISLLLEKESDEDIHQMIPAKVELSQNYPNPFNKITAIEYGLPQRGRVKLSIYNIRGQLVKTLVEEETSSGWHKVIWNGKDSSGKSVGMGVYLYKIKNGKFTSIKKMLLLR
nr:T9SS type A sorting domain-containing protein [Candidatus Cloacimonadota bacterium]